MMDEWNLNCVVCGHENTHPTEVRLYECEDNNYVLYDLVAHTDPGEEEHPNTPSPSPGDTCVAITYSCEGCASISEMCTIHHEGTTRIEFRAILVDPFAKT